MLHDMKRLYGESHTDAAVVVLFSFYLMLGGAKTDIFSSFLAIALLLLLVVDRAFVKSVWADFQPLMLALMGLAAINILFSYLPDKSMKGWLDFFRGSAVVFPALYVANKLKDEFLGFNKVVSMAVYVLCVIAAPQYHLAPKGVAGHWTEETFWGQFFGHYNLFGTLFGVVALYVLVFNFSSAGKLVSWKGILFCIMTLGVFVLIGSRGSLLAFSFAALVRFYLVFKWGKFKVIGALSFIVGTLLLVPYLPLSLTSNFRVFQWHSSGRIKWLSASIRDVMSLEPFTGFGANTFAYLDFGQVLMTLRLGHLHNLVVEMIFAMGLLGSAFFLFVFVLFVVKNINFTSADTFQGFGLCLLVYLFFRGLFDLSLFNRDVSSYLFLGVACLLFSSRYRNSDADAVDEVA